MAKKLNQPWLYLLLIGTPLLLWNLGVFSKIHNRITESLDKNGLFDYADKKFIFKQEPKSMLFFLELDLSEEDLSFEFSKISFAYRWKEAIAKPMGYGKVYFILKPFGGNETKLNNLKMYLRRFDMELKSLKWEPALFAIETTDVFRNKFEVRHSESIVVFSNSPNQYDTKNLDGIWQLYSGETLIFLNSVTNKLKEFGERYSQENDIIQEKLDEAEEQTSLLFDLI